MQWSSMFKCINFLCHELSWIWKLCFAQVNFLPTLLVLYEWQGFLKAKWEQMGLEGHQGDQLRLYYSPRNSDRMRHSQFCPASFSDDFSSFHSLVFLFLQLSWENHAETWSILFMGWEDGFMIEGRTMSYSLQGNEALQNREESFSKACRHLLDMEDLGLRVGWRVGTSQLGEDSCGKLSISAMQGPWDQLARAETSCCSGAGHGLDGVVRGLNQNHQLHLPSGRLGKAGRGQSSLCTKLSVLPQLVARVLFSSGSTKLFLPLHINSFSPHPLLHLGASWVSTSFHPSVFKLSWSDWLSYSAVYKLSL